MPSNVHDNNPLPSICWKRWQKMTWQEAVDEASVLFWMAVKLEEMKAIDARDAAIARAALEASK